MASSDPSVDPGMTQRIALRFFLIGLAVDATVILAFVTHPEWTQYFYAAQFPVLSKLIFGVFFFGMAVTYRNFLRLLREEAVLRRAVLAARDGTTPAELLASLPRSGLRDRIAGLLARPEHAAQADPAGRDALEAREETHAGWAKYIAGVLTMLGLLGTFLGLLVAIDSIRGLTALQDKEAFFQGVLGALDGMGTAFSTSLAGIFGAVVLGFEQLVFHFAQLSFLTRTQVLIERVLGPQVEARESVGGLAIEMHRLREDLRTWRTDAGSAGAELQAAATELGGQVRTLGDVVVGVLSSIQQNDDRWREVSEELASLRRVAVEENQSLLALAGHRVQGLDDVPEGPVAEEEELPEGLGERMSAVHGELKRSNDLLAHIYREMGMVLRSAAQRQEMRQNETLQAIARLVQRMDAQATSGVEQVALLKALLRYVHDDDRRLMGVMGVIADEAKNE